jgi:hypothetical protein
MKVPVLFITVCDEDLPSQDLDASISGNDVSCYILQENMYTTFIESVKGQQKVLVKHEKSIHDAYMARTKKTKGKWLKNWIASEITCTMSPSIQGLSPIRDASDNQSDPESGGGSDQDVLGSLFGLEEDKTLATKPPLFWTDETTVHNNDVGDFPEFASQPNPG